MCPQCDTYCDYWFLKDSCVLSKVTYLFDNYSTVIFSIFMSVWGEIVMFYLLYTYVKLEIQPSYHLSRALEAEAGHLAMGVGSQVRGRYG